jgi:hypothetical protein
MNPSLAQQELISQKQFVMIWISAVHAYGTYFTAWRQKAYITPPPSSSSFCQYRTSCWWFSKVAFGTFRLVEPESVGWDVDKEKSLLRSSSQARLNLPDCEEL